MKGNKKILVAIVLMLLISVTFTTLAIYRSSATATGTVRAAKWDVKVDGTAIESVNYTFDASDITWTSLTGYNDTIAPGSEGYIEIPVSAAGSEVDVLLTAALGSTTLPTGMTANVRINIAWAGAESDAVEKDTTDKAAQNSTLSIPVTLTAKQSLVDHH